MSAKIQMSEMEIEPDYKELCELMGRPFGIHKMLICDVFQWVIFHEVRIDPVLLGKYYKARFGWNWETDETRSLEDFTREKFGDRAVKLIRKLIG